MVFDLIDIKSRQQAQNESIRANDLKKFNLILEHGLWVVKGKFEWERGTCFSTTNQSSNGINHYGNPSELTTCIE